jgi:hypothetical protein
LVPALWTAAAESTTAVAATFLVLEVVFTVVRLLLIRHILSLRLRDQWRAIWPPLVAALVMGGVVVGMHVALLSVLPVGPRLALMVLVGVGVYVGALRLLAPDTLRLGLDELRALRRRKPR